MEHVLLAALVKVLQPTLRGKVVMQACDSHLMKQEAVCNGGWRKSQKGGSARVSQRAMVLWFPQLHLLKWMGSRYLLHKV